MIKRNINPALDINKRHLQYKKDAFISRVSCTWWVWSYLIENVSVFDGEVDIATAWEIKACFTFLLFCKRKYLLITEMSVKFKLILINWHVNDCYWPDTFPFNWDGLNFYHRLNNWKMKKSYRLCRKINLIVIDTWLILLVVRDYLSRDHCRKLC